MKRGTQIVLTAPFTEMIDHAGYFIQMGMASIPIWMEWIMDKKYPEWRNVKRIVALSTHNPLGVTFAAGVYTSIFGSSREPINSHYAAKLFDAITANPHRESFRVLLGGSGSWQITQTKSMEQRGLLASTKPNYWKYLREDAGDIPAAPPPPAPSEAVPQLEAV